ncbi:ABC transporter substrate-binding protein [Reyranella sp. CPCC 100927]|uniref:ABC transporter substrate-binding protein n=1 Tax=Reyranella sp. CPCC 100927 TaxID=2599616 RepID=UPI0011B76108|nr:ABC transporter substrate-binding protein [Reyranella sp. CPCC 100927]TWT12845.1 amino acid ABC transporter substrate-binding protein [Reyranella sp. CPCC 100927]
MNRIHALGLIFALGLATPAVAQDTIKIPNIIELSGAGATVGTNWKNGSSLAVDEINAAGGILGKKIRLEFVDTASDPGKARAAVQRALDEEPIAIFGPIYSGSVSATLKLTNDAEVAQIIGGEAANLTAQGSKYLFRTSFGQNVSMPKIANYLRDEVKAKSVAVIYVNNDFGKGGRDAIIKEFKERNITVAADLSTEAGQADFAADVIKLKGANADAVFVYLNEEESARFLREAKKQGLNKPLIGETTLLGQKVIDLAGDAANGVRGHVGLTVDAPIPAIQEFGRKFQAKFNYKPDHNGVKGYIAPYMIKAAAEKAGKLQAKPIAAALRGLTITPDKTPGILIEASWDDTGEIDRISFLGEVKDGKQVITQTLPKLKK